MKYMCQFGIILLLSLAGDLCHALIPLPIPASIYGMILLLIAFALKFLKVEDIKECGSFLVSLLPLLFVIPTVGLMGCWDLIRDDILKIAVLIIVTTVVTLGISGILTKLFQKGGNGDA